MNWIKSHKIISGILGLFGLGSVAVGAVVLQPDPLFVPQNISWQRRQTAAQWKEDVKNEQLNYRFDFQLEEMRANLAKKVIKHKADYDQLIECLDCFKYPLKLQKNEDGTRMFTDAQINEQYNDQLQSRLEEYERVSRSIERIEAEQRLRKGGLNRKEEIKKLKPSTDREREEMKKL